MTLRGIRRVLPLLSLLGLCCVAACRDAPPTEPAAHDTATATPRSAATVTPAVEDVRIRILPALGDSASTAALDLALRQLGAVLADSTAGAVTAATERVESALGALEASAGASRGGLAPEFEVIRILLAEARTAAEQGAEAR